MPQCSRMLIHAPIPNRILGFKIGIVLAVKRVQVEEILQEEGNAAEPLASLWSQTVLSPFPVRNVDGATVVPICQPKSNPYFVCNVTP